MSTGDDISAIDADWVDPVIGDTNAPEFATEGLPPAISVLFALFYSLVAGGAMSSGFRYLYRHGDNDYSLARNLMWTIGIAIGITTAVYLSNRCRLIVGAVSSVMISGLILCLLKLIPSDVESDVSLFGYRPSISQFLIGIAVLALVSGLLGTAAGMFIRADRSQSRLILGINHRHWLWLWLGLYAWVAILPTAVYYIWLEVISTGYVLVHPSLWFSEAWTEGWTLTSGFGGIAAALYGVELSLKSVSATLSGDVRTQKRVLQFLLGTIILAGPVANVLLHLAISSLSHLPDGITQNPWWILR